MEPLDLQVIRKAAEWHSAGEHCLLVTVARTWGSSPRPPGSLMVIGPEGQCVGSVSGGCIEDDIVRCVRGAGVDALCAQGAPQVLRYGISADEAHRFGLPCGGTVELVLEPVQAHSGLIELLSALQSRRAVTRVVDLHTGQAMIRPGHADSPPRWGAGEHFECSFGPGLRLLVVGAGDLARYLCSMALGMGFEITVCDPRPEQALSWDLPEVHYTQDMPDDVVQAMRPDQRTAIVTLTHDPKIDDLALMDALQTSAFYVGAIGSRRNSAQRRERLRDHFGLTDVELDRLHGPAGIFIGSKTPAEIALSILADIVAAKNGVTLPSTVQVAEAKTAAALHAVPADFESTCRF